MADQFTKTKFDWLDQVQADHTLPPSALKVAYSILSHINRLSGDAWPSQETIAAQVGLSVRSVRDLTNYLRNNDHLEVTPGNGKGRSARYKLRHQRRKQGSSYDPDKGGSRVPLLDIKGGSLPSPKAEVFDIKGGSRLPTNPMKNPLIEPIDREILSGAHILRTQSKGVYEGELLSKFDEWWAVYPRREGRAAAQKSFDGILKSGEASLEILIAGARRYSDEQFEKNQDPATRHRFTKMATTWLKGKHWLDDPAPKSLTGNGRLPGPIAKLVHRLSKPGPEVTASDAIDYFNSLADKK